MGVVIVGPGPHAVAPVRRALDERQVVRDADQRARVARQRDDRAGADDGIDRPAPEEAFVKLYGYTSDADGIRHALMDESDLASEDAKFMLVLCSAFVNYLLAKAARANVAV
jgi:hypothetical protein